MIISPDLLNELKKSLEDVYFSRSERNSLKAILAQEPLDPESVNLVRLKIMELASEKATDTNYRLVMQWLKEVNNLLQTREVQPSHVFFSPGDDCRNAIIRQMNLSLKDLKICVFTISDDQIAAAIIRAHRKGVAVRIITDNDKSLDHGSDIAELHRAGIPVKMDSSKNHMHHKFMVTDDRSLITGSYNWTISAARFNHENILLTKEPGVVRSYLRGFDTLWDEMADYV